MGVPLCACTREGEFWEAPQLRISYHRQEEDDDKNEAPIYPAAGTVMLGLHEDEDCAGVPGATVIITGADGTLTRMNTNRTGTFFTSRRIVTPCTAVVEYDGRRLPMVGPQPDLDSRAATVSPVRSGPRASDRAMRLRADERDQRGGEDRPPAALRTATQAGAG